MISEKRIVVKVGTHVLTKDDGTLDKPIFRQLVVQLVKLRELGWNPILVSSGAVGAGHSVVKGLCIENVAVQRQVLSSVGQASLMKRYYELFHEYDIVCSQVLATKEDFSGGDHYQNMVNCFEGLLSHRIVPVVNENDVVSLTELMFTDNDELASLTAMMVKAQMMIILSNIEGLYDRHPDSEGSRLISEVPISNDSFKEFISDNKSTMGRGGMTSKYNIAKKTAVAGIPTVIANGKRDGVILRLVEGENIGTRFLTD